VFGLSAALMFLGVTGSLRAAPDSPVEERQTRRTPVVEVFEKCRSAVVNIASTEEVVIQSRSPFDRIFRDFFDAPGDSGQRTYKVGSVGSGFIVHPAGYVVTNAHVVARATELRVSFDDGREFEAQIFATDPGHDLAVVRIMSDETFPTLELGRSDDLMIGETVIAIGNPLGYHNTVTAGVVSAVGREIEVSEEVSFKDLIQTDASINPGNSGGPLLNVLGRLVGINTAIRGDAQNIGFAIPVDQLRALMPSLIDAERRSGLIAGVRLDPFEIGRIAEVVDSSPADDAQLAAGDRLIEIDGQPVQTSFDLDLAILGGKPGTEVALAFDRGGRREQAVLELGIRPAPDGRALARQRMGVFIGMLDPDEARDAGVRRERAVKIERLERGGPAETAQLEPGDVLLALDDQYVGSVEQLGRILDAARAGETMIVRVVRFSRGRRFQLIGPLELR